MSAVFIQHFQTQNCDFEGLFISPEWWDENRPEKEEEEQHEKSTAH